MDGQNRDVGWGRHYPQSSVHAWLRQLPWWSVDLDECHSHSRLSVFACNNSKMAGTIFFVFGTNIMLQGPPKNAFQTWEIYNE
jgi:hypothetical protein